MDRSKFGRLPVWISGKLIVQVENGAVLLSESPRMTLPTRDAFRTILEATTLDAHSGAIS